MELRRTVETVGPQTGKSKLSPVMRECDRVWVGSGSGRVGSGWTGTYRGEMVPAIWGLCSDCEGAA
jgi:hypothetical protein